MKENRIGYFHLVYKQPSPSDTHLFCTAASISDLRFIWPSTKITTQCGRLHSNSSTSGNRELLWKHKLSIFTCSHVMIDCDFSDIHRLVTHGNTHPSTVCRRDETNHTQAQALGPGLAVIAALMFSAESHDSLLASCHRTVPGAANPPFEEASPPSREESGQRELQPTAAANIPTAAP